MTTVHYVGPDGLVWTEQEEAFVGRAGRWDGRGVRISSVFRVDDGWAATYDGRAGAEESWKERTGLAYASASGFTAQGGEPVAASPYAGHGLRYLSVVELPGGGYRLYYEATRGTARTSCAPSCCARRCPPSPCPRRAEGGVAASGPPAARRAQVRDVGAARGTGDPSGPVRSPSRRNRRSS